MTGEFAQKVRNALAALLPGGILSLGTYALLVDFTDDAGFLSILEFFSIVIMVVVSPHRNILLGMEKLWLLDWPPIFVAAYLPTLLLPATSIVTIVVHYVCFLAFFLAFVIFARKNRKIKRQRRSGT